MTHDVARVRDALPIGRNEGADLGANGVPSLLGAGGSAISGLLRPLKWGKQSRFGDASDATRASYALQCALRQMGVSWKPARSSALPAHLGSGAA